MKGYLIAAAVLLVFGFGWYCGGLRSRNEMETEQAAQLKALAKNFQDQTLQLQSTEAARQKAVDAYDAIKDIPDLATTGLAERVRIVEASCPAELPTAAALAGGAKAPGQEPTGDQRIERLLKLNQAVYDSCTEDAKQLNAMVAIAP